MSSRRIRPFARLFAAKVLHRVGALLVPKMILGKATIAESEAMPLRYAAKLLGSDKMTSARSGL
jgi:hypothetical protein